MKRLLPLLFALLAVGCEVLEEDISDAQVQITAPSDRVSVAVGSIDFCWAATQYAVGYEFTVVEPSFVAVKRIVVDTVIYADSLARSYGCRVELTAGEYKWSVAGFNGGYKTRTEIRHLTVTASADTEIPEP